MLRQILYTNPGTVLNEDLNVNRDVVYTFQRPFTSASVGEHHFPPVAPASLFRCSGGHDFRARSLRSE